ncbi:unnamed protein product [Calicophoron daubneyi]|uniref:Uncharacterized protein n=1 Tax=Calicophoron daubneyi TaxID=300641 RepID=A0AAV2TWY2_CALDB
MVAGTEHKHSPKTRKQKHAMKEMKDTKFWMRNLENCLQESIVFVEAADCNEDQEVDAEDLADVKILERRKESLQPSRTLHQLRRSLATYQFVRSTPVDLSVLCVSANTLFAQSDIPQHRSRQI